MQTPMRNAKDGWFKIIGDRAHLEFNDGIIVNIPFHPLSSLPVLHSFNDDEATTVANNTLENDDLKKEDDDLKKEDVALKLDNVLSQLDSPLKKEDETLKEEDDPVHAALALSPPVLKE